MNFKKFFQNKLNVIFLFIIVLLVIVRIPSLFEPKWYGDEGIYAAVANEMFHGEKLYIDAWDHKPPAIYLLYTAAKFFGSSNLLVVKLLSLFSAVGTLMLLRKVLMKFVSEKAALISSAIFTFLAGTILFEGNIANAENFFMFFTTLGVYFYLHGKDMRSKILVGISFSVAMLFKLHPLFEFAALMFFILVTVLKEKRKIKELVMDYLIIGGSFVAVQLVSFVLTGISIGSFEEYIFTNITYNLGYTSYTETVTTTTFFSLQSMTFRSILTVLIFLISGFLFFKKKISGGLFLSIVWITGGLFAALLSARPYPHYFLQVIPACVLLTGLSIESAIEAKWSPSLLSVIVVIGLLAGSVVIFKARFPVGYYSKFLGTVTGTVSQSEFNDLLDRKVNPTEKLVEFVEANKNSERPTLFMWGNDAWFYDQINADNVSRYVVDFHIGADPVRRKELMDDIDVRKPQFIIQEAGTSLFDGATEGLNGVGLKEIVSKDYVVSGIDIGGMFMVYERSE